MSGDRGTSVLSDRCRIEVAIHVEMATCALGGERNGTGEGR